MYQLMSFLFLRSISYHFLLMKNKTLSSSAVLSRFSILIKTIINYYTSIINRATSFILLKFDPRWTTYIVSLFRFNLKAMTGVVVVVMMVETDALPSPSPSLSRPTSTDFLHRKTHGQQKRTAFAILYSPNLLAGRTSPTRTPFSSFILIGQNLKIIPHKTWSSSRDASSTVSYESSRSRPRSAFRFIRWIDPRGQRVRRHGLNDLLQFCLIIVLAIVSVCELQKISAFINKKKITVLWQKKNGFAEISENLARYIYNKIIFRYLAKFLN